MLTFSSSPSFPLQPKQVFEHSSCHTFNSSGGKKKTKPYSCYSPTPQGKLRFLMNQDKTKTNVISPLNPPVTHEPHTSPKDGHSLLGPQCTPYIHSPLTNESMFSLSQPLLSLLTSKMQPCASVPKQESESTDNVPVPGLAHKNLLCTFF